MTPDVSTAFVWRSTPAGRVVVSAALGACARHVFSSRDVSAPGQQQVDYRKVAATFDVGEDQVVRPRQVHGRAVLVVTPGEPLEAGVAEADAVLSLDAARVVSVRVADCVPILMADRRQRAVAAVHAGWRGTAAGVVQAAVDAFEAAGVPASDLVAAIGPSIGACCYEVDRVVREAFERQQAGAAAWFSDGRSGAHFRLDLRRANRDQLIGCGVPAAAIVDAGACTFGDEHRWHSHRRDGAAAGRMVAAIRLGAGMPGSPEA